MVIAFVINALSTIPKGPVKGLGDIGIRGLRETIDDSIIGIGQITKNSPGYFRRLAVTQTPVENYQLTKVSKTIKGIIIIIIIIC